jgi:hypothetical protein
MSLCCLPSVWPSLHSLSRSLSILLISSKQIKLCPSLFPLGLVDHYLVVDGLEQKAELVYPVILYEFHLND